MLRFMALILAMIMLFSGVACGYNLLLGGINQNEPCVEPCSSAANDDYKKIAASLDAYYFPMYYKDQGSNIEEVRKAALGEASEQNGLENGALKNHHYETIVAYSGGTSTAVTSLADKTKYGLTCDKLVLISPMAAGIRLDIPETSGASPEGDLVINVLQIAADIEIAKLNFKKQIDNIRANNPNIKIIVIQSLDDKPSRLSNTYQYWFDGKDPGIEVHEADLTKTGEDAHKEIFFNYAASHLANDGSGITFSTTGQSTKPNPFEQSSANQEPQFPASSQPSETAPVAADVNSIGTLQSDVKFIKTTTPTSQILSNLNLEQGTTQTASQSTNAKSANVASSPSPNVQQAIDNMEPVGEYNYYESTIPIPIGPAADALKAQGKYEEYLENALQAAEDRTAQNSQDGDAWYTKGLALYYLNRDEEANVALAQAKELGIQFESNGESFTRVGQTEPTTQATETTKPTDESNTGESTVIPTLYPVTSPPPDESNTKKSSTTSQSTDTKFGDTKLSVTQPVDPQPDLAFGQIFKNNQQMATSSSEPADKQSSKFYVISSNNLDTIETLESIKESNLYFGKGSPKSTTSTYANKNTQTYTLPAPVTSTAAQGSENSVVGTWNFIWNTPVGAIPFVVTFSSDGTFNMPGIHRKTFNMEGSTGRWTQNGDSVRWDYAYSTGTDTFEGTIQMDIMNGVAHGRSWSAERA